MTNDTMKIFQSRYQVFNVSHWIISRQTRKKIFKKNYAVSSSWNKFELNFDLANKIYSWL